MEQLLQKAAQALRDAARYGAGDWSELVDALERRASPASVPEGWKLVPVEPTMEMCEAGWNEYDLQEHFSVRFMYERMIAAAPTPPVSKDRWQPIETAPKETTQMFVVVAFGAKVGATPYNSDPWCVWHQRGEFVRWPHKFSPTHWMPLPEAPTMQEDKL